MLFCPFSNGKVIYVDDDAAGANDGTNWTDAYHYLQDALTDANDSEKPVEIRVAQGIYKPNQGGQVHPSNPRQATFYIEDGVTLMGGYAGLSEPDPNTRDTQLYQSILSGDLNGDDISTENPPWMLAGPTRTENSYHVVDIHSMSDPILLDGFTITGGNASDNEIYPCWSPDLFGGGLRSHADSKGGHPEVIIRNCVFKSNSANNSGGAIDYYSDRSLTVVNCEFAGNYAANGGAIQADGRESSTVNLIGCTFAGNSAVCGAAVSNDTQRNLIKTSCVRKVKMTACNFLGNRAQYGGAAYIIADTPGGSCELELTGCLFAGNHARQYLWTVPGMGLPEPSPAELIINESSAGTSGGALYIAGCIEAAITNCTFASNSAPSGSTIAYYFGSETSPGTLRLHNCILHDEENQIYSDNEFAIVAEYSNIRGGWIGEGNIDADPLFAAPGYWDPNGTPDDPNDYFRIDGDYHLKSQAGRWDPNSSSWIKDDVTSPCIDAGDPNSDWSGEIWPHGERINLGAYGGTREASMSIQPQPMSLPRIVYLYSADAEAAGSFQSLLAGYGCPTTLIRLDQAPAAALDDYDLIIVGDDTENAAAWNDPQVAAAIEAAGVPIIGMGEAGYDFFGVLGLSIGRPNGWHGDNNSIYVVDPNHPLFSTPYTINLPQDRMLQLYMETSHVGINLYPVPQTALALGAETYRLGYYPLVMEQNRYLLWGFTESPQKMTEIGKKLFINVVVRTANKAWESKN